MAIVLVMYSLPVFVFAVFFQVIIVWIDIHTGTQWPVANWGNPWQYTWSDLQFKIGPIVILALAGLPDSYISDGRVLVEGLTDDGLPASLAKNPL
jgi:ABC-type dipeptide/oligopeptide/nickel transport system permease component